MRKLVHGTCLLMTLAAVAHSQTFEVASIKVSELSRQGGEGSRRSKIENSPGSLTMRNVGLPEAIIWAYKVSPFQIPNRESLNDTERYDILAKAAAPAKVDEMRIMPQGLLAERFKLALHRETKEMSAFALVEAKGGHKLKESEATGDGPGIIPSEGPSKVALTGQKASLDQLAFFLSSPLRTPVIDKTGLKGQFDFTFDLTEFLPRGPRQPGEPEPDPVSILQLALPKQLGLRLEARKMPVEVLIVDHVDKLPVEN